MLHSPTLGLSDLASKYKMPTLIACLEILKQKCYFFGYLKFKFVFHLYLNIVPYSLLQMRPHSQTYGILS